MKFLELLNPIQQNTTLNPKIWEPRGELKAEVRGALLRIAEDFEQFVGIPFTVEDIVITGSNVNYNYTDKSDLDLHLITDYAALDCAQEAEELFDAKRHLYEQEHDVKIYGIPVTLYVEDRNTPGVSGGLFSVANNRWITKPQRRQPKIDLKEIDNMVLVWHTLIDNAERLQDLDTAETLLKLARTYRKLGLKQPEGEFSTANLVYKVMRMDQSLERLQDLRDKLHDRWLSVT
jgi:hypothetical protein